MPACIPCRFLQHRHHGIFPGVSLQKHGGGGLQVMSEWGRLLVEMEFISHYYEETSSKDILVLLPIDSPTSLTRAHILSKVFPKVTARTYRYLPYIDEEYDPDRADIMTSSDSLDLSTQYVFPDYHRVLLVLPSHLPEKGATTLMDKVAPWGTLWETFVQDIRPDIPYSSIVLPIFTRTPLTSLVYLYVSRDSQGNHDSKDNLDKNLLEQELTCHQVLTRDILQQHVSKTWISSYDVKVSAYIISRVARVTESVNEHQLSQWLAQYMHSFLNDNQQ